MGCWVPSTRCRVPRPLTFCARDGSRKSPYPSLLTMRSMIRYEVNCPAPCIARHVDKTSVLIQSGTEQSVGAYDAPGVAGLAFSLATLLFPSLIVYPPCASSAQPWRSAQKYMNKISQTIIDGLAVFAACLAAIWIRFDSGIIPIFHSPPPPYQPYIYGAMAGTIIVILALHATNNYRTLKAGRLLGGSLLGVALLIAASYIIRIETAPPFSRFVLLLAAALIPLFLMVERLIVSRFIDPRKSKGAEQSVPGYPPQGVGSPEP